MIHDYKAALRVFEHACVKDIFGNEYDTICGEPIETIKEALRIAEKHQWQPIETAPKDGEILVYNGESVSPSMWYESNEFRNFGEEGGWCSADYDVGGSLYEGVDVIKPQPTHWMPLPDAPIIKESEEQCKD